MAIVNIMKATHGQRSPLAKASACGKAILFGEHAVVYGRPALAVPVKGVRVTATVFPAPAGQSLCIEAADLGKRVSLADAGTDDPLAATVRLVLSRLNLPVVPDWLVTVRSTIPIASGLGSGAAVSTALVRALAAATRWDASPADVSTLVFEIEKLHHGTPSGIDNTVIAFERPLYFVRGRQPQFVAIQRPLTFIIADSGVASPTGAVVADVRQGWQRERDRYEDVFDRIAQVVASARVALAQGDEDTLGALMDENHDLLRQLGVSSGELERLRDAALAAGAKGAKLSGAGRGGSLLVLVASGDEEKVAGALGAAGAKAVIVTQVA